MEKTDELKQRQFANLELQLKASEEQAEKTGDEDMMEAVSDIRNAIGSKGLSVSEIRHTKEAEASREGGKTAVASYETGSDQIQSIGAEGLVSGAESAGLSVREYTSAVFNHELTHRKSRKAEGASQTDRLLTELFGEKAIHNTEEAAASQAEGATQTARFDTYDTERSEVRGYADKLGLTNAELLRIRVAGDYRAIILQLTESGEKA